MKKTLSLFALSLIVSFNSTLALASQADDIQVSNPYAREVPPGSPTSASFMVLKNTGTSDIKLTGASSQVSKVVELHTHINNHGVMRMRRLPFISIAASKETKLQPGGLHIMLINLHKPLVAGKNIEVVLRFEDGSTKTVNMPVKSVKGHRHH